MVGLAETKNSKTIDVYKQIGDDKRDIRTQEVEYIRASGEGDLDVELSSETLDDDLIYGIGDGSKYDVDIPSSRTFDALYEGFKD